MKNNNICKDFIAGNCTYVNCKFIHKYTKLQDKYNQQNKDQNQDINRKHFTRKRFIFGEHKNSQNNNIEDRTTSNLTLKKTNNVCWDFIRGSCRFGDRCKFSHNEIQNQTNEKNHSTSVIKSQTNTKQIYVGDIKANITSGFKITKLLLDNNSTTHLVLIDPPLQWNTKEIIKDIIGVDIVNYINYKNCIKLYFNSTEDLEIAENIIKKIGICKHHGQINCSNISCIISSYLNRVSVIRCCKSYFNEIIVYPTNSMTTETLIKYLDNNDIIGYKKIKESNYGTKKHKFIIKFESDIQASKLLLSGDIIPGATIMIGNDVVINYKTYDLQFLNDKTLEEYIIPFFDSRYDKPKIIMPADKDIIQIQGGANNNRLIARRNIIKLIKPSVINYSRALLRHINRTIIDTWKHNINVVIDVNIPYGKIIIKGLPNDKDVVIQNIKTYFQNERNLMMEKSIPLSVNKSLIKRMILNDYRELTKLGTEIKILYDDIVINGPKFLVEQTHQTLTNIISRIIEYSNQITNEHVSTTHNMSSTKDNIKTNSTTNNEKLCAFCSNEVEIRVNLRTCKCTYCRDCFKHVLLSSLSSSSANDDIKCLSCGTPILLSDGNILDQNELKIVYQAALNKYLVSNWHKYYKCPTVDCDNYLEIGTQDLLYCNLCSKIYCKRCDVDYNGDISHEGLTCETFLKCKKDDIINNKWILENSKPCPNCAVPIEKNEGCNHMRCFRCTHEFCWICLCNWTSKCYSCRA